MSYGTSKTGVVGPEDSEGYEAMQARQVTEHAAEQTVSLKLLLTVDEAARALGVGRTSVFGLVGTGELFSVKVCGRRLVPVWALHEFVERVTALQKAG